jgi:regulator of sigma D
MTQDEIIEMAKQAWADAGEGWVAKEWFDDRAKAFEAFAKLVEEKATEEANARANASWTLMCKKMVAFEREACAKVCDELSDKHTWEGCYAAECAGAIRARGEA